jgi:hypothetical protein
MARSGHLSSSAGHQAPAPDATWAAQGNAAKLLTARSVLAGPGPSPHPCTGPHRGGPCRAEAREASDQPRDNDAWYRQSERDPQVILAEVRVGNLGLGDGEHLRRAVHAEHRVALGGQVGRVAAAAAGSVEGRPGRQAVDDRPDEWATGYRGGRRGSSRYRRQLTVALMPRPKPPRVTTQVTTRAFWT